ncbi:hypothetical protein GQ42DRAFT_162645 [Ramicandelaber brevisporus]|nr:hypothetical protein GQ42DRAFT_162645 [Ramicandelaber brevisporus]
MLVRSVLLLVVMLLVVQLAGLFAALPYNGDRLGQFVRKDKLPRFDPSNSLESNLLTEVPIHNTSNGFAYMEGNLDSNNEMVSKCLFAAFRHETPVTNPDQVYLVTSPNCFSNRTDKINSIKKEGARTATLLSLNVSNLFTLASMSKKNQDAFSPFPISNYKHNNNPTPGPVPYFYLMAVRKINDTNFKFEPLRAKSTVGLEQCKGLVSDEQQGLLKDDNAICLPVEKCTDNQGELLFEASSDWSFIEGRLPNASDGAKLIGIRYNDRCSSNTTEQFNVILRLESYQQQIQTAISGKNGTGNNGIQPPPSSGTESPNTGTDSGDGLSAGAKVGIAVGAVALVVIVAVTFFILKRRRGNHQLLAEKSLEAVSNGHSNTGSAAPLTVAAAAAGGGTGATVVAAASRHDNYDNDDGDGDDDDDEDYQYDELDPEEFQRVIEQQQQEQQAATSGPRPPSVTIMIPLAQLSNSHIVNQVQPEMMPISPDNIESPITDFERVVSTSN